jgi:hypothetical protein
MLGLGQLALARNDAVAAEGRAEQALQLAADAARRYEQALAWLLLGQTRESLVRTAEAARAYGQARAFAEALELPHLYGDATAGMANTALAAGDIDTALRYAEELPPYFLERQLGGCCEPGWVTLSCHRVFQAADDPRADEILRQGVAIIERQAAALPKQQRPRFLDAFQARQSVLRAWVDQRATSDVATAPPPMRAPATSQTTPATARGSSRRQSSVQRTTIASPSPVPPDHPEEW